MSVVRYIFSCYQKQINFLINSKSINSILEKYLCLSQRFSSVPEYVSFESLALTASWRIVSASTVSRSVSALHTSNVVTIQADTDTDKTRLVTQPESNLLLLDINKSLKNWTCKCVQFCFLFCKYDETKYWRFEAGDRRHQ